MIFFYVLGAIIVITILILWIIYLTTIYREKEEPTDGTILENYMPQFSDGYTELVIDKKIERGDRIEVIAYPRDIDYKELFKKNSKIEIKPYKLFFLKSHFENLPRNSFSEHRNKAKAYPPRPEDVPEGIKNTLIGAVVMERIKDINSKDHELDIVRQEAESIKMVDRKEYSVQRISDFIQDLENAHKSQVDMLVAKEGKQQEPKETK